jgi:hypothetical protein
MCAAVTAAAAAVVSFKACQVAQDAALDAMVVRDNLQAQERHM